MLYKWSVFHGRQCSYLYVRYLHWLLYLRIILITLGCNCHLNPYLWAIKSYWFFSCNSLTIFPFYFNFIPLFQLISQMDYYNHLLIYFTSSRVFLPLMHPVHYFKINLSKKLSSRFLAGKYPMIHSYNKCNLSLNFTFQALFPFVVLHEYIIRPTIYY